MVLMAYQVPHVFASPRIPVGTWWTIYGDYQTSGSGTTGKTMDSYSEQGDFVGKIVASNSSADGDQVTFQIHFEGNSTCQTLGPFWPTCDKSPFSWNNNRTYTVSLTNDTVTYYVNRQGNPNKWGVGHRAWFITNPTMLTKGGTTPYVWCTPTSDDTDCTGEGTDVQAAVSSLNMNVKGNSMEVWTFTYTGTTLGEFYNDNNQWSRGTETDHYMYDPVYGIWLGGYMNSTAHGIEDGAPWTDTYIEHDYLKDTNLSFNTAVTIDTSPSGTAAVIVDGTQYAPNQLPKVLSWLIGSSHTISVNSTIQSGDTRYVFTQWSNGLTSNPLTYTAGQNETLTANYKTQYLLTVQSDYGSTQGSGWYDSGSQAAFSISTTSQPESGLMGTLGGTVAFQGWSGATNTTNPTGQLTMDGPKTITAVWATNNSQPYMILGGLALVIIIVLAAVVVLMKRKPKAN